MCERCDMLPPGVELLHDLEEDQAAAKTRYKRQQRILDLLSLMENPDALPPQDAVRVGQEILALLSEVDDDPHMTATTGLPRLRRGARPNFKAFN
jgi:hypothetical protein